MRFACQNLCKKGPSRNNREIRLGTRFWVLIKTPSQNPVRFFTWDRRLRFGFCRQKMTKRFTFSHFVVVEIHLFAVLSF
jgi:hypothetical protein